MKRLVEQGELHPKKAKEGLALRIIADFHGERAAKSAREEFERVFAGGGTPDEIPEHSFAISEGTVFLPELLRSAGLAASKSEANRLLRQGAVSVDGEKLAANTLELAASPGEQHLFKVGKRRFVRVTYA